MHGLKSAILVIFQKLADWLDWPCPGFFFSFIFKFSSPSIEKNPNFFSNQLWTKTTFSRNGLSFWYSERDTGSVRSLS